MKYTTKELMILCSFLLLLVSLKVQAQQKSNDALKDSVTFYKVPMVCPASPDIGCGSLAKPVLLALESIPGIRQAWLNRQGTVLAIVWDNDRPVPGKADSVFQNYSVGDSVLSGRQYREIAATFPQTGRWYQGLQVDQLSLKEAKNVSLSVVSCLLEKKYITTGEEIHISSDIKEYFKKELIHLKKSEKQGLSESDFRRGIMEVVAQDIGNARVEAFQSKIKAAGGYRAFCQ